MIRSQREVGAYRERLDGHSATFTIQYHQWASLKGGLNIGTRYSFTHGVSCRADSHMIRTRTPLKPGIIFFAKCAGATGRRSRHAG